MLDVITSTDYIIDCDLHRLFRTLLVALRKYAITVTEIYVCACVCVRARAMS